MITITFTNNTSESFSATDTTLAVMERWGTALKTYYTSEACRKKIPTDYKGFRLSSLTRVYWRVTKSGCIYEYIVAKKWDHNGRCSTRYSILPIHDSYYLRNRMNYNCSWDGWGNRSAMAWVVENGRKKPMGLRGVYDNKTIIANIINGWIDKGYKMFGNGQPYPMCSLRHKNHRGYTWRGRCASSYDNKEIKREEVC